MKKRILIILLTLIISIAIILGFRLIPKLNTVKVPKDNSELGIHENSVDQVSNTSDGEENIDYDKNIENILLIGIDGNNYRDARSDVIIIATINKNNGSVKLTSVMRDTLVHISKVDDYQKINHAYMYGGPLETMKTVNRNLDLNIKNFVTFNYDSLIKAIDFFGGFPVNLNSGEAKDMKLSEGEHILNGRNALTYARVRKNSGGDTGRNSRQREIIMYILEQSKQMSKTQLIKFANILIPEVETSYSYSNIDELLDLYISIKDNISIEQNSFPFEYKGGKLKDNLWYAVPTDLETNVIKLHQDILEKSKYKTSNTVFMISDFIKELTGYSNSI